MPPGLSSILGSGCFFLAIQMGMGRRSSWLPKRIAKFRFPRTLSLQLLQNIERVTKILEKIVRPRWLRIAESPYVWQSNGTIG